MLSQAKFCKDAQLLDKSFAKADIDMVWSKVAGKCKKVRFVCSLLSPPPSLSLFSLHFQVGSLAHVFFLSLYFLSLPQLDFDQFKGLLNGVANKKGCPYEEVEAHVLDNAKVTSSGTKGESRFYDDKSTWTGAAVQGGPTNVDNVQTLASLSNRDNKADARGVVQK
jgi:hypothetical protein